MRKKLIILLSLIILIGVGILLRDLPTNFIYASDEDFAKPELCLGTAIGLYHKSLNDLFNNRIDLITSGKPNTFIDKLPEIDSKTGKRKPCESNNVTTYCVAHESLKKYEAFLKVMKIHQDRVSDVVANVKPAVTIEQELEAYAKRQQLITREIKNAKNALDLSLATYHEFRSAYPMHKKFETTLSLLEKYRDNMGALRNIINMYQYKFIDVTTTKCI
ncbi:hypothetical protein KKG71_02240 [Patescibacteria group bacterium]|nr:hypothetical protein [Patescibacteria group bacterium]